MIREQSQAHEAPAMTPQQQRISAGMNSPWSLYRNLCVGDRGIFSFALYELLTFLFSNTPGMLGLGARAALYPLLFERCAGRPVIGKGTTIRNPAAISLGRKVLIDDYVSIDAKGAQARISLGDFVSIGKFSILAAKSAQIRIGNATNIGTNCRIATQSKIEIGASTLIAAYCYIGPGNHQLGDDDDTPLIAREMEIKGGVSIGSHVWIGARATILDGVSIGDGAIIGAHSLVRDNVPPSAIVAGTPARSLNRAG